jgi:Mg2+ and Co2+ transporter CorA
MSVEDQIDRFARCVRGFAASVSALDERLFLTKVNAWTPRDIVAHLIGWNRHIVRGAKQILRGELPFFDVDPGPDYSKVNAALVRECGDTDRSVLLERLDESAGELMAFVRALAPTDWDRDFGVRHKGEMLSVESTSDDVVTVQSTVDDLIADYDHHRGQLDELRTSAG